MARVSVSRRGSARGRRAVVAFLAATLLILALWVGLTSTAAPVSITVPYSTTSVADGDLEGDPSTGAWEDALSVTIPLENGESGDYGTATLFVKHDGSYIYFRIDGSIDVPWESAIGDRFWLGVVMSSSETSHHKGSDWDGTFFGLWDGTDYEPQPTYPPVAVDTNGFGRPPAMDASQDVVGAMMYFGSAAPYSFTAEWKRPLDSGDPEDLVYRPDGLTSYYFFVTTDSNGGGSSGGSISHNQATNLNTMKLASATSPNQPATGLTPPVIQDVVASYPGCLRVTWETVQSEDVAGYRLYRWNSSRNSMEPIAELPANATSYLDCNLEYDHVYTYWITSFNSTGAESSPSLLKNGRTGAPPEGGGNFAIYEVAIGVMTAIIVILTALLVRRRRPPG